jgi:Uma2 family endonuclease
MVAVMEQRQTAPQTEQMVILRNVSWSLYEQLSAEQGDICNPRFAYDNGILEIKVASFEHEQINRVLAETFGMIADELGIDFIHAGSTTFKRRDLEKGFEPDSSFYIRNADAVRGKTQIDLKTDPPPDLVIEIDITSPSLNKFPIFAGLGITEVWRYSKGALTIFKLDSGEYREEAQSLALPGVTGERLTALIAAGQEMKRTEWLRSLHEWAQELKSSPEHQEH